MEEVSANNVENPLIINLNRNCTHKLHLDCAKRLIRNNLRNPNYPRETEMFNQQLHPLAACPSCMRGGGLAYATTRHLVEKNIIGWRLKVMIRVPGQREIVEARCEWSHYYVSFRVDDNETGRDNDVGQADVNFGERDN
jgi:hypothetical protein